MSLPQLFVAQAAGSVDLGNMENYFTYSVTQWDSVSHILTLGVGVFAAALIYFLATTPMVAPKYRVSNILSAVVAVSAALILLRQAIDWDMSFAAVGDGSYVRKDGQLYSNGYRYMNWSIDVPVLLLQMLVILPLAARLKISYGVQFLVAGLGMIWTSWAAQFFEHGGRVDGVSATPFWVWYLLGWAFYVWIVVVVWKAIGEGKKLVPDRAKPVLTTILWLFMVSWTAYAFAIAQPQFWWDSSSGVARAFIFTLADISSKAVYGVLLGWVALILSKEKGFEPYAVEQEMQTRGGRLARYFGLDQGPGGDDAEPAPTAVSSS